MDRAVEVRSVTGARYTTLDGQNACRCVSMTHSGALMEGFTLAKGYYGWCGNYVLGTLKKCIIRNCYAQSGNRAFGAVYLGGGRLENCLIYANTARGGARSSGGIGLGGGSVVNCTITGNSLLAGPGGGGLQTTFNSGGLVRNCIMWGNSSPEGTDVGTWSGVPLFTHCCMPKDIRATEYRINSAPQFVNAGAGDYRLAAGSPCLDAGAAEDWMAEGTDMNGDPRVLDGNGDGSAVPDAGAYEYFPTGYVPFAISSSPALHGTPRPLGYGTHAVVAGRPITNSVDRLVEETNGAAFVCAGWAGTGSVPPSGTGTSVVFTVTQYSTITWLWQFARPAEADYGDAPSPYPTTLAQGENWHAPLGPTLGVNRDTETNGQPTARADGDDADPPGGPDDEDGVTFSSSPAVGQLAASVAVNVQQAPAGAKLDAWVDFNRDGTWGGPFERIADSRNVTNGNNVIHFDVPGSAVSGPTYARFRLSTPGALGPGGYATDGEMEDCEVALARPLAAAGIFGPRSTIAAAAYSVSAADMDGDGDMDVIGAMESDEVAWFENNGVQSFTKHSISIGSGTAMSVIATDVDGDGHMDVISAHTPGSGLGRIVWHRNDGNQNFTEHVISARSAGAGCVFAADMDGDGDLDVCVASWADNTIAWYENDGHEGFQEHVITTGAMGATSVFAADMDHDGDVDVLSASPNDNTIAWYENDGSQSFIRHRITAFAAGVQSVVAADLDDDGDMDVLSSSAHDGRTAWYENDGGQSFNEHGFGSPASGAYAVSAGDIDGDGDLDVVGAWKSGFYGGGTDRIMWYENDGSRGFIEHVIVSTDGAYALCVADVDGDGDLDVLSSWLQGINVGQLAWYENTLALDSGDLPVAYHLTTLNDNGARHKILNLWLGATVDAEPDGKESAEGDGDDNTGTDDEDGIRPVGQWVEGPDGGMLLVEITGGSGYLSGWIDWNSDNDLGDPGEQILDMVAVARGVQVVRFDIPTGAMSSMVGTNRFARFRLAADALPLLTTTGLVINGEVEDYHLPLGGPPVVRLEIVSPHGEPQPPAGQYLHAAGVLLTNRVTSPEVAWPTQYVSTGWVMGGNAPSSGTNTLMAMTHTNDAVLSWEWKTQFWVSVVSTPGGSVAPVHEWRDAGSTVEAVAAAAGDWTFSRWLGVPGADATNNPLRIEVDGPLRVVAQFVPTNTASARTHYVDIRNDAPVPPYTNWQTAATVIQDALDACDSNDVVLVAAGTYETGGRAVYGGMTNRVAITNAVTVLAVDGAEMTQIKGLGPMADGAVRCAYVGNGALLSGFTLTNGFTRTTGGFWDEQCGGGAWCAPAGVVSNCIITGSSAAGRGGGVIYGTVVGSVLRSNSAGQYGGGGCACSVVDCVVEGNTAPGGGGLYDSVAVGCRLTRNTATSSSDTYYYGGGAYLGTLDRCTIEENCAEMGSGAASATVRDCLIVRNGRSHSGGGLYVGSADNCTIIDNAASFGSGTYKTTVRNCIVWGDSFADCFWGNVTYTCAGILYQTTGGEGNTASAPLFVAADSNDYRLQGTSPCIDAGTNASWMIGVGDLEGNPRILNGTVDMGAYEYVPLVSLIVMGDPVTVGSPLPFGYGTNSYGPGTVVSSSVEDVVQVVPGIRYVNQGWTGTGNVPATGGTNRVTFTITTNSMLTWRWRTEYYLTLTATNGTIAGTAEGWKPAGFVYDLTPSNAFGFVFDHWMLDGTNAGMGVPLTLTSDAPHRVEVVYVPAFVDVSSEVETANTGWWLSRQTGTFFGDFQLCVRSDARKKLIEPFWYVVETNANMRLMRPSGIEPVSGFPYVDVTTQVLAQLPLIGNGDMGLDPGECVTVTNLEFYSRDRSLPQGFLQAVWADPPGAVGAVSDTADTDHDGIPNAWERRLGLDINDPSDGIRDDDGDGLCNRDEYRADTRLDDRASCLRADWCLGAGGALSVGWVGGVWATQVVERSWDLRDWVGIYTSVPPTPETNWLTIPSEPPVFVRIKALGR